jgi:hypothetical protein
VARRRRGFRPLHQHGAHLTLERDGGAGARRRADPAAGGVLNLYGPDKRGGAHTAPSNDAFDASLRARNPDWGVRDLEAVAALAAAHGFSEPVVEAMPANNLSLVFRLAKTLA